MASSKRAMEKGDDKSTDTKERTITVSGIPEGMLPDEVINDKLTIHFQRSKNGGGDVETVYYPTKIPGVAYVVFDDIKAAKRVLEKEHFFEHPIIPGRCKLKISVYSEDVFTSVSVILDLNVFHEKYSLQAFVQHLKGSFNSLTLTELDARGRVNVNGPFSAIKKLREYLLSEIETLQYRNDLFPDRKTEEQSFETFSMAASSFHMKPVAALADTTLINKEMLFVDTDIYKYMVQMCKKQYEKELEKYNTKSSIQEVDDITVLCLQNACNDLCEMKRAKLAIQFLIGSLQRDLRKEQILLSGYSAEERKNIEKVCKDLTGCYRSILILPVGDCIGLVGSSSECYNFIQDLERITGVKIQSRNVAVESKNTTAKGALSTIISSSQKQQWL